MNKFSIKETIRYSYEKVSSDWGTVLKLIGVIVLIYAPFTIFGFLTDSSPDQPAYIELPWIIVLTVSIISWLVQMHVDSTRIQFMFDFMDGNKPNLDMFKTMNKQRIVEFVKGTILYGLIVFAGFILFIIPGIIWSVKYSQWQYLVVAENMSAWDAIKRSGEITRGNKLNLVGYGLVMGLLGIIAIIPIGLGLLLVVPMSWIGSLYIYRQLASFTTNTTVTTQ